MIIVLSLSCFAVILTSSLTTKQGLAFITVSAPTREEVEKLSCSYRTRIKTSDDQFHNC